MTLPSEIHCFSSSLKLDEIDNVSGSEIQLEMDKDRLIIVGTTGLDQLSPEEAFLISRISGPTKLADLLMISPFGQEQTKKTLEALLAKKAIRWKEEKPRASTAQTSEELPDDIQEIIQSDQFDFDTRALDLNFRRQILLRLKNIEQKSPFDILGIRLEASDHDVRSAYLSLSRQFHPDRFFRKPLGHYKRRLDQLFTKIQEAYAATKNEFDREALGRKFKSMGSSPARADTKKPDPKKLDPKLEKIGKAEHFYKLGLAAQKLKDYSHAATQFQMAIQLNPERPQYKKAYEEVAPFLELLKADQMLKSAEDSLSTGLSHEALEKAERVMKLQPDSPLAKLIAAKAIIDLGEKSRLKEAIDLLRRAKSGLPKDPEPCILLSQIFHAKKETDKALLEIEEALRRDPESSLAHKLLSKYSA